MKTILKIAGTSVGGSSYSLRIMNALTAETENDVEIVISKGKAQQAVYEAVLHRALELHEFVSTTGGAIKQKIEVIKR